MIDAAIPLLQNRGLEGMSFTDVLAASGAARGAIYHHFPEGKAQLAQAAAQQNGEQIRGYVSTVVGSTPGEVVRSFLEGIRGAVTASSLGGGCAVAAVSIYTKATQEEQWALLETASGAFSGWADELAAKLVAVGMTDQDAKNLSLLLITVLEGAHPLCRAARSLAPFEAASAALLELAGETS